MSALGQKRTYTLQKGMSALPPESRHVRCDYGCPLWAKSGHCFKNCLLDQLIGTQQQRWRKDHSECVRGFKVYDQFKFGGLFNR